MLDLLQPFTEGLLERDASSSTLTAWGDPKHEVVEAFLLMRNYFPWLPPNQEITTMCSLIIRKVPILKSVRRQKTTGARCRIKPKKRVDGIALPTIVQDDFTNWIRSYPMKTKDTSETVTCVQRFRPPSQKPEIIYTDNSKELIFTVE